MALLRRCLAQVRLLHGEWEPQDVRLVDDAKPPVAETDRPHDRRDSAPSTQRNHDERETA